MAPRCSAIIPGFLGLLFLLLGLISGLWCRLVYIPPNPDFVFSNGTAPELSNLQFGLYLQRQVDATITKVTTVDNCVAYSFNVWDAASAGWRTAMVTLPISWAIAFLLSFSLIISACCTFPRKSYRVVGLLFVLLCCPLQGLLLLVLTSNLCSGGPQIAAATAGLVVSGGATNNSMFSDECLMGASSYLGIAATAGYFLTGLACCFLGKSATTSTTSSGKAPAAKQQPTTTTAAPPAPQPASPPPAAIAPAVVAAAAVGAGAASRSVASHGTRQTQAMTQYGGDSYDEENPPNVAAAAAVGGIGGAAVADNYDSRKRQQSLQNRNATSTKPRISAQEQRDLAVAAATGAAVGASARADSVKFIPAVVKVSSQDQQADLPEETLFDDECFEELPPVDEVVLLENPDEQRDLVVAAATGAAVGATARADSLQNIPSVVQVEEAEDNVTKVQDEQPGETVEEPEVLVPVVVLAASADAMEEPRHDPPGRRGMDPLGEFAASGVSEATTTTAAAAATPNDSDDVAEQEEVVVEHPENGLVGVSGDGDEEPILADDAVLFVGEKSADVEDAKNSVGEEEAPEEIVDGLDKPDPPNARDQVDPPGEFNDPPRTFSSEALSHDSFRMEESSSCGSVEQSFDEQRVETNDEDDSNVIVGGDNVITLGNAATEDQPAGIVESKNVVVDGVEGESAQEERFLGDEPPLVDTADDDGEPMSNEDGEGFGNEYVTAADESSVGARDAASTVASKDGDLNPGAAEEGSALVLGDSDEREQRAALGENGASLTDAQGEKENVPGSEGDTGDNGAAPSLEEQLAFVASNEKQNTVTDEDNAAERLSTALSETGLQ